MIYAIVDNLIFALKALKVGIKVIQYRQKNIDDTKFYQQAQQIQELCRQYKAHFIINDRLEIAKKIKADGVHLGQKDADCAQAKKYFTIIGISVHNLQQALTAQAKGATYLGVGPMFPTINKPEEPITPLGELKKIKQQVKIPIVAIGGLNEKNLAIVLKAGADAAAFISELKQAQNLKQKVKNLQTIFNNNINNYDQPNLSRNR